MAIGLDEIGFVWEQFGCDIPHFIFRVGVVSLSYHHDYGMKHFASTRHGIYAKRSPVEASQGSLNWYEPYILPEVSQGMIASNATKVNTSTHWPPKWRCVGLHVLGCGGDAIACAHDV